LRRLIGRRGSLAPVPWSRPSLGSPTVSGCQRTGHAGIAFLPIALLGSRSGLCLGGVLEHRLISSCSAECVQSPRSSDAKEPHSKARGIRQLAYAPIHGQPYFLENILHVSSINQLHQIAAEPFVVVDVEPCEGLPVAGPGTEVRARAPVCALWTRRSSCSSHPRRARSSCVLETSRGREKVHSGGVWSGDTGTGTPILWLPTPVD